ncbi:MAG TPA: dTDP-4-dehydrorhamnose 3,5-epimerase [Candidatus Eisenbacteria bacterium]|nr:dTDP-4-dehydrorhamnose 3,5-epimerase [Candidatus Eisenbacteria bacterium]
MKFTPTSIPDVLLIEPKVFSDERGFFFEDYNREVFARHGLLADFVQDNHSRSRRGALRGLHFQVYPKAQSKLVRVVRGEVFDVAVDLRKGSPTYGRHVAETLSEENRRMLFIPAGFAHGFLALKEGTEVLYKVTDFYSPAHDKGLAWNDPALGIAWPKLDVPYEISPKDRRHPALSELAEAS